MRRFDNIICIFAVMMLLFTGAMAQTYRLDDEGEEVKRIQQAMSSLGIYYAQITGHYGPKTASCVREFQRKYGLKQTGEADEATVSALYKAAYNEQSVTPEPSPVVTAQPQASLVPEGTVTPAGSANAQADPVSVTPVPVSSPSPDPSAVPVSSPSPTPDFYSASGTLRAGSHGDAVRQLQKDLCALGIYEGSVTGHFGTLTENAVRRFQRRQHLRVDGIAGPATLSRIRELKASGMPETGTTPVVTASPVPGGSIYPVSGTLATGVTLRRGSRNGYVKRLQNALGRLGYYSGEVTGYFGKETEAAVRAFQKVKGLTVDGIAGRKTLTEINKLL